MYHIYTYMIDMEISKIGDHSTDDFSPVVPIYD